MKKQKTQLRVVRNTNTVKTYANKNTGKTGLRKTNTGKTVKNQTNIVKFRSKKYRRRKNHRKENIVAFLLASIIVGTFVGVGIYNAPRELVTEAGEKPKPVIYVGNVQSPSIYQELLTVNEYSRPGIALKKVKGIVIHYTANPGTSAQNNRDYFEGLKDAHTTKASSHFIVGLDGEVIQCVPCEEIAYASNSRNQDTVSIECCIPDDTGMFNEKTYDSLVQLTAWLVDRFELSVEDIIRHYDVTGKNCPKYYVENPKAWEQLLADVKAYIKENGR